MLLEFVPRSPNHANETQCSADAAPRGCSHEASLLTAFCDKKHLHGAPPYENAKYGCHRTARFDAGAISVTTDINIPGSSPIIFLINQPL